jgi:hypothetical protein
MGKVEGMLKGLKPSELEMRVVRIGGHTRGRIDEAMRGIDCKDLGDNKFIFAFHQALGKKKAIDGGRGFLIRVCA